MKFNELITFILIALISFSFIQWHYDLGDAKNQALKEHKFILLSFSGSDWCGPCIRMDKEIFESPTFSQFADSNLVLVNADFPRKKKNKLSVRQQDLNNSMADSYNSKGIFPLTVLLDDQGKVLKKWEGFPNIKPEEFVEEIKSGMNAVK